MVSWKMWVALLGMGFVTQCTMKEFVLSSRAGTPADNDPAMLAYVTIAAANAACGALGYVGDVERVKAMFRDKKNIDWDVLLSPTMFGQIIEEAIIERAAKMRADGKLAANCDELARSLQGEARSFFYKRN